MQLITRADWDGLVCAVLLGKVEKIEGIYFAHPKDMQDGKVPVPKTAIIANLPYHPNCALWFDHHVSEEDKTQAAGNFKGKYGLAPSAARLVYEYYGGEEKFPGFKALIEATDKIDSAQL
ncbi:MAG: exopolyphosphatase, partial [Anaerolineales bacterium]